MVVFNANDCKLTSENCEHLEISLDSVVGEATYSTVPRGTLNAVISTDHKELINKTGGFL